MASDKLFFLGGGVDEKRQDMITFEKNSLRPAYGMVVQKGLLKIENGERCMISSFIIDDIIRGGGKTLSFILVLLFAPILSLSAVDGKSVGGIISVSSSNTIVLDAPERMQIVVETDALALFSSYKTGLTIVIR